MIYKKKVSNNLLFPMSSAFEICETRNRNPIPVQINECLKSANDIKSHKTQSS